MSHPSTPLEQHGRWERLPERLRPRTHERASGRNPGDMWLIETTLLVLVGLLLAIATVNDVARQRSVNGRLIADLRTWRHYTGHDYRNVEADQELLGVSSQKEVVCGNTSPGAPQATTQICLMVWGPVVNGTRTIHGGWYLPAKVEDDVPGERYGCFGPAAQGLCPR
jgi:hypothetical protein